MKVKLEHDGGRVTVVTTAKKISGMGEAVSDVAAKDKPGLIRGNQRGDAELQPISQDFGDSFDHSVLQDDRPEVMWAPGILLLRKKHQVRSIEPLHVRVVGMKGSEEAADVTCNCCPDGLEEQRAEPVGSWAGVHMHMPKSQVNFLIREVSIKITQVNPSFRVDIT